MIDLSCPHCHKPYVERTISCNGYTTTFPEPQCDCEEEARKREEAAEKERERLRRVQALNLPEIFAPYWLKDLTCEHAAEARPYVEGFTPRRSKGLFIYGPNGNGKSTLAAVICKELAYRGRRVLFTTMTEVLDRMEMGVGINRAATAQRVLNELMAYDFIMFDDYGRENYTPLRLQNVFQIIDRLYTHRIVFGITANPECIARFTKIPEMEAIADRMAQVLMRWEFTKPSFRRK
ncbi:MAG: ATP-binding protein [Elusimicrobiaceae bacterium]|nr:ATP-binding protein [Elusimicrobiaceae bacterium]